jgi:hypothetical protein
MKWIGQAVADYEPDVVVHLGDHWDFSSVSSHSNPGSLDKEGKRVVDDIATGNDALELLHEHMSGFKPKRKIILRGNHEHRLTRYVNNHPELQGLVGDHLFNDTELGWEVVPYFNGSPRAVLVDGIQYAHYFANPNSGQPIGGTIQNRLSKIGSSFVQGHQQGLLQGNVQYATGLIRHGIVAGSSYLHDEEYKGMANAHWRGIVVLNEVEDGQFSEMPLTLDYLSRKYEGMSVARFLQRNYKNARERFTLANKRNGT